jgi:hypothetical protein
MLCHSLTVKLLSILEFPRCNTNKHTINIKAIKYPLHNQTNFSRICYNLHASYMVRQPHPLYLVFLIIFCEEKRSRSPSLYSFIDSLVTSSPLRPNILL